MSPCGCALSPPKLGTRPIRSSEHVQHPEVSSCNLLSLRQCYSSRRLGRCCEELWAVALYTAGPLHYSMCEGACMVGRGSPPKAPCFLRRSQLCRANCHVKIAHACRLFSHKAVTSVVSLLCVRARTLRTYAYMSDGGTLPPFCSSGVAARLPDLALRLTGHSTTPLMFVCI